jgi:hypothetical protein
MSRKLAAIWLSGYQAIRYPLSAIRFVFPHHHSRCGSSTT